MRNGLYAIICKTVQVVKHSLPNPWIVVLISSESRLSSMDNEITCNQLSNLPDPISWVERDLVLATLTYSYTV